MRGTVPLKLYIYTFARRRKGSPPDNFLIPGKRSTDLYLSLWSWLTKPSEGASGHLVRMPSCRYNDWIKNLYKLKSRVHPSGNYVDPQRREVATISLKSEFVDRIIWAEKPQFKVATCSNDYLTIYKELIYCWLNRIRQFWLVDHDQSIIFPGYIF